MKKGGRSRRKWHGNVAAKKIIEEIKRKIKRKINKRDMKAASKKEEKIEISEKRRQSIERKAAARK